MKIEKAIEILTVHNDHNPNFTDADREEAHQLGIEALERIALQHLVPLSMTDRPLPSETES